MKLHETPKAEPESFSSYRGDPKTFPSCGNHQFEGYAIDEQADRMHDTN